MGSFLKDTESYLKILKNYLKFEKFVRISSDLIIYLFNHILFRYFSCDLTYKIQGLLGIT